MLRCGVLTGVVPLPRIPNYMRMTVPMVVTTGYRTFYSSSSLFVMNFYFIFGAFPPAALRRARRLVCAYHRV